MAERNLPDAQAATKFLLGDRNESASELDRQIAVECLSIFRVEPGIPGSQEWRAGKYAIRDEDVDFVDAILSAAPTAAAVAIATPSDAHKANVAGVVAACVATFKVLRSVFRNYGALSAAERVLIATLKVNGGAMPESKLVDTLTQNCPKHFADDAAVRACLDSLSDKAVRSGEVKDFITVDGEKTWRSAV